MAGLLDFFQGASNAAASNISAPVDGLAWLLKQAGMNIEKPIGGSDWMRQKGLTAEPENKWAGLLGESVGGLAPIIAAAKAPQIARGLLQGAENLAAPRTMNPQTGAIVWHGSPHKFDKFDASKIGTGEGAQAYGHGLYLAEDRGIADVYRKKLTGVDGAPVGSPNDSLQMKIGRLQFEVDRLRQSGDPSAPAMIRAYEGRIKELDDAGNLYKVDLPDEQIARMLDWDKPLSQQAPEVRAAAGKLVGDKYDALTGKELIRGMEENATNINGMTAQRDALIGKYQKKNMSWADAVRAMTPEDRAKFSAIATGIDSTKTAPSSVSSALNELGVPGIRYLDGASRGAGAGSSNYVVFPGNEGLLSILERNGQSFK